MKILSRDTIGKNPIVVARHRAMPRDSIFIYIADKDLRLSMSPHPPVIKKIAFITPVPLAAVKRPGEAAPFVDHSAREERVRAVVVEARQRRYQQGQPAGADVAQPVADHPQPEPDLSDGYASHVHGGKLTWTR
jgi:hypothetical protein